jgi:hypothetical protein
LGFIDLQQTTVFFVSDSFSIIPRIGVVDTYDNEEEVGVQRVSPSLNTVRARKCVGELLCGREWWIKRERGKGCQQPIEGEKRK